MKIGLYFGSFNPIHVGHLIIANYMTQRSELDQVWLVVSPQNPHKQKKGLLADHHRLALVRAAVEDNNNLKASNVEFDLPKPSYTVTTLAYLQEQYPQHAFALIMGEDNLRTLHKWRNYETILENHHIYVYPRPLTESELQAQQEGTAPERPPLADHPNVQVVDAPLMKVSASFIRNAIANGEDVRYLLTEPVYEYVTEMHFYKRS